MIPTKRDSRISYVEVTYAKVISSKQVDCNRKMDLLGDGLFSRSMSPRLLEDTLRVYKDAASRLSRYTLDDTIDFVSPG